MVADRFHIEIVLANGITIPGRADTEDADHLLGSRAFTFRRDMPAWEKQLAAIESQLAHSIEKGTGLFVVRDEAGNEWIIRSAAIVAAHVTDNERPDRRRSRMGFGELTDDGARPTR